MPKPIKTTYYIERIPSKRLYGIADFRSESDAKCFIKAIKKGGE